MKRDKQQKPQNVDSDEPARKLGDLRRLIQEGLDSGPASPLDMDEVKRKARKRWEAKNAQDAEPYSSLDVLLNAHLDGPSDASVTYETKLYERKGRDDE